MKHRTTKYRHRGPTHSLAVDSSDSTTYYVPIDPDYDVYDTIYYGKTAHNIDPWDLENYNYVRKQMYHPADRALTPSPQADDESLFTSNLFYLPNNIEECPACCAGMDEQTFYNTKYETILDEETPYYGSYTDFEYGRVVGSKSGLSDERNSSSSTSSVSSLMLHTPGFGPAATGHRCMVLPKPAPYIDFPAPPSYGYYIPSTGSASAYCPISAPENNFCSLTSSGCCKCSPSSVYNEHKNIPLYAPLSSIYGGGDDNGAGAGEGTTGQSSLYSFNTYTNKFGLSKKGLLQIDYSYNWNDLDRYIATKAIL